MRHCPTIGFLLVAGAAGASATADLPSDPAMVVLCPSAPRYRRRWSATPTAPSDDSGPGLLLDRPF